MDASVVSQLSHGTLPPSSLSAALIIYIQDGRLSDDILQTCNETCNVPTHCQASLMSPGCVREALSPSYC